MVHISEPTQDTFTSYSRIVWWWRWQNSRSRTWNLMRTAVEICLPYESIMVGKATQAGAIATTEQMREGLHDKNERSLAFSIFLDRIQKMFNIYEEEGEEFTDNAKLRKLFKWVQHLQLQDTVKALKVRFDMEGITYTQAANHLTAAVLELPEYHLTCKVSALSSGTPRIRGGGGSNHNSIIKKKGGTQVPSKSILMSDGSFSWGITRTGWNYQKKISSAC